MKFARLEGTELALGVLLNCRAQFFVQAGRLEPRKRQVRCERALFPRDPLCFGRSIDVSRERREICRRVQSCPEHARMLFIGEKSESAKLQIDSSTRTNCPIKPPEFTY